MHIIVLCGVVFFWVVAGGNAVFIRVHHLEGIIRIFAVLLIEKLLAAFIDAIVVVCFLFLLMS